MLGAVAPVLHVVPRTQRRETADMVHVDLAGVPGHRLGHTEHVGTPAAQEVVPEPQVGAQLGVVPGVAADVVAPGVPPLVVGVHDIAEVPETVPAALFDLVAVEVEIEVQLFFDALLASTTRLCRRPAGAEHPGGVQALRAGQQQRRCLDAAGDGHQGLGAGRGADEAQRQFAGARDPQRRVEARLVVLVGDVQGLALAHEAVLAQAIVIRTQVHRHGLRGPQPEGDAGALTVRRLDIQLRRVALPEVPQAEHHSTFGRAQVADTRGAVRTQRVQPGVPGRRALANLVAIRVGLQQPVAAERRHEVQALRHLRREARERPGGAAFNLRAKDRIARIAAQPGQAAHRLGEHTAGGIDETHMAIMQLAALWRSKAHTDATDEVVLAIDIQHQGMHQADLLAAGVQVQPHDERQQPALAIFAAVAAVQRHHRAQRPALFQHHPLDLAAVLAWLAAALVGIVLYLQHQVPVEQGFAPVGLDPFEQLPATPGNHAAQHAGIQHQAGRALLHPQRGGRCRRAGVGAQPVALGGPGLWADGVRAPLQAAVRPVGQRPALQRRLAAVVAVQAESTGRRHLATRPGRAPGHPERRWRQLIAEPVQFCFQCRRCRRRPRVGGAAKQRQAAGHQGAGTQEGATVDSPLAHGSLLRSHSRRSGPACAGRPARRRRCRSRRC
ncbi:MAG: hypothetical protein GAK45_00038 [Pseudomonas citronellolis]|nr:MAG: hypothetical protein GAK45_00038 [Pseudomonas citronellolis]